MSEAVMTRICRLIGHDREAYVAGWYTDRRGRRRERWYTRCKRCGASDGGEVFRDGLLERFAWWRLVRPFRQARGAVGSWIRLDCHDCGKPEVRFGRDVGDHGGCLPF